MEELYAKIRERIVIQKVARLSIVINAAQILLMVGIALAVLFGDSVVISSYYVKAIIVIAACVVAWGAAVDIREALMARRATNARGHVARGNGSA